MTPSVLNVHTLRIKDERLRALQDELNLMFRTNRVYEDLLEMAVQIAEAQQQGYAQYAGHYRTADWTLGMMTKAVQSKGGTLWKWGDIVLLRKEQGSLDLGVASGWVGFSIRLGWHAGIPEDAFKPVVACKNGAGTAVLKSGDSA